MNLHRYKVNNQNRQHQEKSKLIYNKSWSLLITWNPVFCYMIGHNRLLIRILVKIWSSLNCLKRRIRCWRNPRNRCSARTTFRFQNKWRKSRSLRKTYQREISPSSRRTKKSDCNKSSSENSCKRTWRTCLSILLMRLKTSSNLCTSPGMRTFMAPSKWNRGGEWPTLTSES